MVRIYVTIDAENNSSDVQFECEGVIPFEKIAELALLFDADVLYETDLGIPLILEGAEDDTVF